MRKLLCSILFLFLTFSNISKAQTGWSWLNPIPQGNHLRKVQLISPNLSFAVGEAGTILKTTDGGINWQYQRTRTNLDIQKLSFSHPDSGFVCGDSGLVLKTVNGGNAWFRQNVNTLRSLLAVYFLNSKTGWVAGENGTILKTTNAGTTWASQNSQTTELLTDLFFQTSGKGWAVGSNGTLVKTTDGGTTWATQTSGTTEDLLDITFLNNNFGAISGKNGLVSTTTNGGENWIVQATGADGFDFEQIVQINPDTIFAAGGSLGQNPLIAKSTDGGINWDLAGFDPSGVVSGISFFNYNQGLAVGQNGQILKSNDGFATATNLRTGYESNFNACHFSSIETGIVLGATGSTLNALKTTNGGSSWNAVNFNGTMVPFDIQMVDETIGYACGSGGGLFKTTNGGDNWESQTSNTTESLWGLHFLNTNIGTAVGTSGIIRKTTDGGQSWNAQTSASGTGFRIFDVYFADASIGFMTGENGIEKTTNAGQNWANQITGDTLYSLHFLSNQEGITVGNNGKIFRTTNGGINWNPVESGTSQNLKKVHFTSANQGIIVGEGGIILRTFDGGQTWRRQVSYNKSGLQSGFLVNDTVAYVVGTAGTILKTTTGGSTCPDALFNYTGVFLPGKFCQNDTLTQSLYFDGTPGGTFSATPPGLNINATTGIINPILSTPGNYSVQYQVTPPNGCPTQNFSTTAFIQTLEFIPRAKLEVTRPPYALPPETPFVPCQGDTLLTKARNKFANLGFAWYKNNQLMPDTTQEIKVSSSGMYAVKYRDQACAGPFYDTVQIDFSTSTKPITPALSLTDPVAFCNDNFTLSGPNISSINYQWIGEPAFSPQTGQTNNTLTTNQPGTYRLQIDSLGCKSLSEPFQIFPVGADTVLPSLYTVSTKGTNIPSERNSLKWNRITYDTNEIKRVRVYRRAFEEFYFSPIAEIPATDSVFTDEEAFPGGKSFTYRISAKQLCGTELFFSPTSNSHQSIHLEMGFHPPNFYALRWSEPLDVKVKKYRIFRGTDYDNLTILNDSVPFDITSSVDVPPGLGPWFYRIEAETDQDYLPWGRINAAIRKSTSNTGNTTLAYCDSCALIDNIGKKIHAPVWVVFPNPHAKGLFLSGLEPEEIHQIRIFNSLGKEVFNKITLGNSSEWFEPEIVPGFYRFLVRTARHQKIFPLIRE